ncbi:uncharacterized protein KZ484_010916 [Pholidichthys leucotaenia]
MEPRREDVPQQNDFKQEEVLDEQQLLHQKRNLIVVQVGADFSQIKEEQEEDVCLSQEGEQFGLKQETQTFDEEAPQLHDCKEEEVLNAQQLWNQERSSSLEQEEQNAAQVKEEEEEFCSSQEEDDFGLKQDTDAFMVTPTDEDNVKSETEPNSEQLLSHNSPDTESQVQGAGKNVNPGYKHEEPKPKKRLHRNRSDRNNARLLREESSTASEATLPRDESDWSNTKTETEKVCDEDYLRLFNSDTEENDFSGFSAQEEDE